jgi:hypothetical protein
MPGSGARRGREKPASAWLNPKNARKLERFGAVESRAPAIEGVIQRFLYTFLEDGPRIVLDISGFSAPDGRFFVYTDLQSAVAILRVDPSGERPGALRA